MKRFFSLLLTVLLLASCARQSRVASSDGAIVLSFRLSEAGQPQYRVTQDKQTVIEWSSLGLLAGQFDLTNGFKITGTDRRSCDEAWETVWGEERQIVDRHNEMTVHLMHTSGMNMDIIFRVYNDGFAFRYAFPEQAQQNLTITDEVTEYRFVDNPQAWSIPWRTEYYEGIWTKALLSEKKDTLCSPLTLELPEGRYAFIHEAALTDYPAQNFYISDSALCTFLTPWLSTNDQRDPDWTNDQSIKAYEPLPFASPWRFVILTRSLREMVASRIMLNLNEPCRLEDTSWIKPMKFIGIWWCCRACSAVRGRYDSLRSYVEGLKRRCAPR